MSEFWVSRKKYWCRYCECFIADDKPSRTQHESGLRHQGNKERYVRQIYKSGEKRKRDLEEEKREMLAVDRAAQSAYAQDIAAGRGGSSTASLGASSQPTASTSNPKPKAPVSKFANYSTAASLGYVDEDAERAAALAEQRSKEGTVGAWEVVVPPPPPLPVPAAEAEDGIRTVGGEDEAEVDVKPKPPPEPAQEDENDFRSFKVRQKKAFIGRGLGALYDPGEIVVKKKQKVEDPEPGPEPVVEPLPLHTQLVPGAPEDKGGWQRLDEQVNPSVVLPRAEDPPPQQEKKEAPPPLEDNINGGPAIKSEEEMKPSMESTPEPGGSLFKARKIKRPINGSASRRGGRF